MGRIIMPGETPDFNHPLMQGCVGLWLFNAGAGSLVRNLADPTGNTDGQIQGNAQWSGGQRGSALAFDGIDDFVDTADINTLDGSNAMTISAYVCPTVADANLAVVAKWDFPTQATFAIQTDNYATGKIKAYVATSLTDSGAGCNLTTNTQVVYAHRWSHLVFVFDGTQAGTKIYVDSKSTAFTLAGSVPQRLTTGGTATVKIGKFGGSLDRHWSGAIEHVMLYNRALSAEEVRQLYGDPYQMFARRRRFLGVM